MPIQLKLNVIWHRGVHEKKTPANRGFPEAEIVYQVPTPVLDLPQPVPEFV